MEHHTGRHSGTARNACGTQGEAGLTVMTNFWKKVRAFIIWLFFDTWRFLAPILFVLFLTGLALLAPGDLDDHIRYAGLLLQLGGITTVVLSLRGRRRLFHRPSLIDYLLEWLAKAKRSWWSTKSVTISVAVSSAQAQSSGGSISTSYAAHDTTIEARLAAMEANIKTLKSSQAKAASEFHKAERKWAEAMDSERQSRELAIVNIKTKVDTLGAGSLHIETAGLFWLILGVVMGTIPTEIAMWLQMIP